MNIIVASGDHELINTIADQFYEINSNANLSLVDTIDDLIEELKSDKYEFIIVDYYFDGIDIWQLSKLINSKQLAVHALPLYLIQETCETEIPLVLAKEHAFHITSQNDLIETLNIAQLNHRETGYFRGILDQSKPSLLVIEDDQDAAEVVYLALNDDYQIDVVNDGEKGLLLWRQKRHDLVLLDYMLPGLKGNEVLTEIMRYDNNQPVIIMTAYDKPESNKNFILNGASQYLPKPFSLQDLRSQCQSIINKSKLIYQAFYAEQRLNKLTELVYELDQYLNTHNISRAKQVLATMQTLLPSNLTEDEKINLLNKEF